MHDGNVQLNRVVAFYNANALRSTSATAFKTETNFDGWLQEDP